MSSFNVGTAHRSPVQRDPIMHILVLDGGDWRMWCTSGKGRPDSDANTSRRRYCGECKQLVLDAHAEEMMDPSEMAGFKQFLPSE